MSILEEAATLPSSYFFVQSPQRFPATVLEFVRNGNVRRLARMVRSEGWTVDAARWSKDNGLRTVYAV